VEYLKIFALKKIYISDEKLLLKKRKKKKEKKRDEKYSSRALVWV
jgi:hypothetical protein